MRAKLALFVVGITVVWTGGTAGSASSTLAPLGVGIENCDAWIRHHEAHDQYARMEDEWVAGFLTGYNAFMPYKDKKISFFRFDSPNLPSGINAQCRTDPRVDIYTAATKFISALRARNLSK